jgi:hypothetical protein
MSRQPCFALCVSSSHAVFIKMSEKGRVGGVMMSRITWVLILVSACIEIIVGAAATVASHEACAVSFY